MSCCPVTSIGAVSGNSESKFLTYGQTSLYVAGPASAKAGVLAFPDIFGTDSGRIQKDADTLGLLGYAVVVVDLAAGEYVTPEIDRLAWLTKQDFDSVLLPRIQDALAFLKTEKNVTSVASYGYCWGAWVGARLSAIGLPEYKGNVSFHPSWKVENMLHGEGAVEKLTESLKAPQLLCSAGDDPDFLQANGSVHKILSANSYTCKLSDVIDFPDMNHGWVNRGDISNEAVKAGVMKAWHAAVKFIETVNLPQ